MDDQGFGKNAVKIADVDSYDRRASDFEELTVRFSSRLAARMLQLASVRSTDSLLDVGTGTGLVAIMAAEQCDRVVAIDHSAGMLAEARASADRAGLAGRISFDAMDAEALDLGSGNFDAILSLFVVRHLPNPVAAIREMQRVLKPGGRVVISAGARPDVLTLQGFKSAVGIASDRLMEKAGRRALSPTCLRRFLTEEGVPPSCHHAAHSSSGNVDLMLNKAGFSSVRRHWWSERHELTPELFWEVQAVFDSEARAALSMLGPDKIDDFRHRFVEQMRDMVQRGATLIYRTGVFIYSAQK